MSTAFKSCPICWERDCNHSYEDLQAYFKECDDKKKKEDLEFSKRVFPPYILNSEEISINAEMFKEIDSSNDNEPLGEPVYEFKEDLKLIFESYLDEFDALSTEAIEDIISIFHEVFYIGKRIPNVWLVNDIQTRVLLDEGMKRKMKNLREEKKFKLIQRLREDIIETHENIPHKM